MTRYQVSSLIPTIKAEAIVTHQNEIIVYTTVKGSDLRYGKEEALSVDGYVTGYVTEGSCTLEINNLKHHLTKGSRVLLTPSHTHRLLENSKDCQIMVLIIDSICTEMTVHSRAVSHVDQWSFSFFNPVIQLEADELEKLLLCMKQIQYQIGREGSRNHIEFILNAVELHQLESDEILIKHSRSGREKAAKTPRRQQIMTELMSLVAKNYRTERRVGFYSDRMCLTGQYINQICNEHLGMTLSDIIAKLTYATSRNILLSTEKTIQQIAAEMRFPDQATFCKFFKKMSGMTPSEMRKESIRNGTFNTYQPLIPIEE